MTVLNESGDYEDFLAYGFTEGEIAQLWSLPDGVELFNRFIKIEEPMRHRDMGSYAESLGLSIGSMQLHCFIDDAYSSSGYAYGELLSRKQGGCGRVCQRR